MSTNLMQAHNQWATRPNDERFFNLKDMGEAMLDVKTRGRERTAPTNAMLATTHTYPDSDSPDLVLTGSNGVPVALTHWSGGQLCQYVGAPANYIRSLPPELAAQNINHGLKERKDETASLLINRNTNHTLTLRSLTTEHYARWWNVDIISHLRVATDNGWMVPPARPVRHDPRARPATLDDIVPGQDAFGLSVKVGDMIAPAGCYASDRDMFVFMVNPKRVIDLDGDSLMRGFFLENSEVGAKAFKLTCFYLEAVCGNHICWKSKHIKDFRKVHKGDNFRDFTYQLGGHLRQLTDANTSEETKMISAAKNHVLGKNKEEVVEIIYNNKTIGLTKATVETIYEGAERWEHTAKAAPNTTWGFVHSATRYSQTLPYADERAKIDSSAGKMLQMAYVSKN